VAGDIAGQKKIIKMKKAFGAFYGFKRLFSILPSLRYNLISKNFTDLLRFIGDAENKGRKT
jgi:hypothetical protein